MGDENLTVRTVYILVYRDYLKNSSLHYVKSLKGRHVRHRAKPNLKYNTLNFVVS